ncbi:DALR anticodon-binding domain-containing protein [Streptomyces profundus]|uniref:DALR anticodon-binding domain-containing protein n=1 Tax=Streptomyces profundus TaxID=2867410 RepID=UPI001D1696F3|nr:DALR anticodon-binding domain-containing protein [Streptomyces sp. MA3_2.13]UED84039.1 arginine--tRNA ligase [Streptomyces sp. MA3_2.13]
MTPAQLSHAVLRSVRGAVDSGELSVPVPERAVLRRPPRHVDARAGGESPGTSEVWSCGIALRLAGPAGKPAGEVARMLSARLERQPGVAAVRVTGGGFLTIALDAGAEAALLREILSAPPAPSLPDDPARDAARWSALAGGDPAGALLTQREENPLFLVRYARARCAGLERAAEALGVVPEPGAAPCELPAERALLAALGEGGRPVGRLTRVADRLLTVEGLRPTLPSGDEKPEVVHRARLALALAAGTVLADGLHALGISAPHRL